MSGDTPPSGGPTGMAVQPHRVGDVGRVRRHVVAQHGLRHGQAAVVVDPDRVAQHVAGIDDARRHRIDLQRRRLVGVQQRHDRDGMRVLVVDDADGAVGQRARVGGAERVRRQGVVPLVAPATFVSGGRTECRSRAACDTRRSGVRLRRSPKRRSASRASARTRRRCRRTCSPSPATRGPLPGTGVTPSAANTRALVICGVVSHIPPVGPSGSRSSNVTLNASRVPVFRTSRAKSPYSAGFIVAGPVLSTVSSGVPGGIGGNMNCRRGPSC